MEEMLAISGSLSSEVLWIMMDSLLKTYPPISTHFVLNITTVFSPLAYLVASTYSYTEVTGQSKQSAAANSVGETSNANKVIQTS